MGHNLRIKLANKFIMKKTPCTVKKTNDWATEQIQFHMSLVNIIERSQLKYCGHTLRTNSTIEGEIMQQRLLKREEEEDQDGDGYRWNPGKTAVHDIDLLDHDDAK